MKKVLVVGPKTEGAYTHVVHKVLKDNNYLPYIFNNRRWVIRSKSKANQMFLKYVEGLKPDYVLSLKGRGLSPDIIEDIAPKTILWWLDNVTRYSDFEEYRQVYDKYYVIEAGQGHPWMPIGIDPEIHKPIPNDKEKWQSDVVFAGTGHPRRTPRIMRIVGNMPWNTKIWGNSWNPDTQFYQGEAIYWDKLMMAYTNSKIILNNHYEKGITPNMRTIEGPASGAVLLSDTGEGINECLEPGKEYIPYDGLVDAKRQIAKYLEEKEEREKIARAGYERVINNHLLIDKLEEMFR